MESKIYSDLKNYVSLWIWVWKLLSFTQRLKTFSVTICITKYSPHSVWIRDHLYLKMKFTIRIYIEIWLIQRGKELSNTTITMLVWSLDRRKNHVSTTKQLWKKFSRFVRILWKSNHNILKASVCFQLLIKKRISSWDSEVNSRSGVGVRVPSPLNTFLWIFSPIDDCSQYFFFRTACGFFRTN